MEINNLIPHIESLIFASDKPLTTLEILELVNNAFSFMDEKIMISLSAPFGGQGALPLQSRRSTDDLCQFCSNGCLPCPVVGDLQ